MKRVVLSLVMTMLLFMSAASAQWVEFERYNDGTVLYVEETPCYVQDSGKTVVEVWTRLEYGEQTAVRSKEHIDSVTTLVKFKLKQKEYANVYSITRDRDGQEVRETTAASVQWRPVIPDTVGDHIYSMLLQRQQGGKISER